jgi:poly-gamma-glutamate synthesis protein (capsule biosynthesis protein)
LAVGDVGFGGRPTDHEGTPRLDDLFEEVRPLLEDAEIVFGNFEGVLSDPHKKVGAFTAPVSCARALSEAGFNFMHVANNHALDEGEDGLGSTIEALSRKGIKALGVGQTPTEAAELIQTEINGLRIGWLAAGRTSSPQKNGGWCINELDPEALVCAVQEVVGGVDCLIASLHCGYMWVDYPDPDTRDLTLRLTRAGVHLVLAHHPHVLQGLEVSPEGAVICYSLGNFLFDWRAGEIRSNVVENLEREGGIFCFDLDCEGVASASVVPTVMDEDCSVRWPGPERATRILDRVQRISGDLRTGEWKKGFWRQRGERNSFHGLKMLWSLVKKGRLPELVRELSKVRWHHFTMLARWFTGRSSAG